MPTPEEIVKDLQQGSQVGTHAGLSPKDAVAGHIEWFGTPEKYAAEILRKESAGESLADVPAADAFRAMYPHLFPQQQTYAPPSEPAPPPQYDIRVPEAPPPEPAPEPKFDARAVQQILDQYGIRPMSDTEIRAYADALVQRQSLGQMQAVQRQLDRFEETFPNEFERAKEQIRDAAAEVSAEHQEAFAARGMFYSSIMAGALTELDESVMEHISEIARDAANYVSELHRDLQDIEQWAAIEREVVRHQITVEERDLALDLSQIHMEVMKHGDMYALDAWAQEQQNILQHRQVRLQEMMTDLELVQTQADWSAMAKLADTPEVQAYLHQAGITPEEFHSMDLAQRASIVEAAMGFGEWAVGMESEELQNRILAIDVAVQERYAMAMADLNFEKAGIDVALLENELEEQRMRLAAAGKLNYFERLMALDIDQAAADLDLTRAQIVALKSDAKARLLAASQPGYRDDGDVFVEDIDGLIYQAGELTRIATSPTEILQAKGDLDRAQLAINALPHGPERRQKQAQHDQYMDALRRHKFWNEAMGIIEGDGDDGDGPSFLERLFSGTADPFYEPPLFSYLEGSGHLGPHVGFEE